MKHNWNTTILLLSLFLLSQVFGLFMISSSVSIIEIDGEEQVGFSPTAIGERPESQGLETLVILIFGVGIGTLLLLYLAKKNKVNLWKAWFFLAGFLTISISLGVFLPVNIAYLFALGLVGLRFYYPNVFIININEILMYSGLAIFLAPLLDITTMLIILVLVSVYDMYAVWKSKHMITMARFTAQNNVFPGLNVSTKSSQLKETSKKSAGKKSMAIIGGGDVVFPLLFAGTLLIELIGRGYSKAIAFQISSVISIFAVASLVVLFYFSKKDKFYPAMPFISAGVIIGYLAVLLI